METSLDVTPSAAARITHLLSDEKPGTVFRISVIGGGCSGFSYKFDFDPAAPAASDFVVEKDGAKVVVDDVSLDLIKGSVLDYTEDLSSAGFEIKNPQAKMGCGCGNSFSV